MIELTIKTGFWLLNLLVLPLIVAWCVAERVWQWAR